MLRWCTNQMSSSRAVALLPLYSLERVTNSEPGKRIMAKRHQLSYACSYSYLMYFFVVCEVVTREWNNLCHLRVPLFECPFQSESECEIVVFVW